MTDTASPQTSTQPSSQTTRLLLVRHGQSLANAGGAPPDNFSNPLTELGHAQAKALAEGFPCEPTQFLVSPYLRARQTAEPLLKRFPSIPVEEWPIQEFTFLEPARHKGTTDLEQEPHSQEFWQRCDPTHTTGPGAECFTAFLDRARDTLRRLTHIASGGCIVVFTHGLFMQAVRLLLLFPHATDAQLMYNFRRFHFSNFINNTDSLEFEITEGKIRLVDPQHISGFLLEGETLHA